MFCKLQTISWRYVEQLHFLQEKQGLRAANKLRQSHINFQRQKMKVKLAAQVFSSSVAKAMLFAKQSNEPGFEDCEETVDFIETIDRFVFETGNNLNC